MTEQHRTVAAEHDLPRVREWIDQAVRHAVNEAAQAFNAIRYWCEQQEATIREHEAEEGEGHGCETCAALALAVRQVRNLLPDFPAVHERRAEPAGGGDGMEQQGTRVTRFGGDEAAFGDDDDRDL